MQVMINGVSVPSTRKYSSAPSAVASPQQQLPPPIKERVQACASCKHQRKKCTSECAFAPYFPSSAAASFEAVQKVFGVSNMAKMMARVGPEGHGRMFESLVWEARGRERDPAEGCYVELRRLQQENAGLRSVISSSLRSAAAAPYVCRRNYQYHGRNNAINGVMTVPPQLHAREPALPFHADQ